MIKINSIEDIKQAWLENKFYKTTYKNINGINSNHIIYRGKIVYGKGNTDLTITNTGFTITTTQLNGLITIDRYLYNPISKLWEYKGIPELRGEL